MSDIIELRDCSFEYQATENSAGTAHDTTATALNHVTLTVRAGEVVMLCGQSGCGKTTVTRLLNGLIPEFYEGPLTGLREVGGLRGDQVTVDALVPLAGSVFQNPKTQYFNADTTSEMAFACENLGWQPQRIRTRLAEVARRFELGPLLDRPVFTLSGGQQQRLAVAAATMPVPRIMVMDEPTSNLDAEAMRGLHDMVARLKADGVTVMIAEHRLAWCADLVDRYVVFEAGRVAAEYTAAQFHALSGGQLAEMGLRALDMEPYRRRVAELSVGEVPREALCETNAGQDRRADAPCGQLRRQPHGQNGLFRSLFRSRRASAEVSADIRDDRGAENGGIPIMPRPAESPLPEPMPAYSGIGSTASQKPTHDAEDGPRSGGSRAFGGATGRPAAEIDAEEALSSGSAGSGLPIGDIVIATDGLIIGHGRRRHRPGSRRNRNGSNNGVTAQTANYDCDAGSENGPNARQNATDPTAGVGSENGHNAGHGGRRDAVRSHSGATFTRAIPDLQLAAGRITGLMGRNGAGKTTLLRTLCGLERPLDGRVLLHGRPARAGELTRAGFLVMQDVNYQLFADSVREEVLLGASADAGIAGDADATRRRCDKILAGLDLLKLADRHPMSLSGGQKQRLAIASALMCGKELIMLDEPTSGLDRRHMMQVGALLRQVADAGRAVLVVTHDDELAALWCDAIVRLDDDAD
ncbi:energy-coupling factor ABC transporter ATP-binding protein [Bifidobacterium leontopitheci]|uniref:ABC transporter ATP-binding protein n=1 Tax=Bifidobacterium leontopitheci TaxID=2650774 RepID=A0A6I1GIS8_9BIFI|nr:energy-coupling factor ABC transporter ATP-binding protein [Bifidobacterium leontopitheci]KAB7790622.1 ABC transporter ATP-binding protein [Bifidobacterium leontopitheci]